VATGAIAGSVFVLGRRAIVDIPTLLVLAGAYLTFGKARRVPEPVAILAAGVIGFILTRSR
jgi:chromate transporter